MAYTVDMRAAARRHLQAAESLHQTHRRDVAGYLYGIAAECALKAMMHDAGIKPTGDRRNDPYYLHFPELKTVLLDRLSGRTSTPLTNFLSQQFMQFWAIEMRYCDGREIEEAWIKKWHQQAKDAVAAIGT